MPFTAATKPVDDGTLDVKWEAWFLRIRFFFSAGSMPWMPCLGLARPGQQGAACCAGL